MLEPERLDELLPRLRLTAIRDQLDSLLDEASRVPRVVSVPRVHWVATRTDLWVNEHR